jgi:hypothetical protein
MRKNRVVLMVATVIAAITSTASAGILKHDRKVLASASDYDSRAIALVSKAEVHVCKKVCPKTGLCLDPVQ